MKKLTRAVTTHPLATIGVAVVLTCVLLYGASRVEVSGDIRKMLPETDPVVAGFELVDETFGGADFIMLALEADDIFASSTLSALQRLTEQIGDLEAVSGVRSLMNAGEIVGTVDGIEVVDLIHEIPEQKPELSALRTRVLSNEDFAGSIISEDGKVAAVIIQLHPGADNSAFIQALTQVVESSPFKGRAHLAGYPVTQVFSKTAVVRDMRLLIPFVIGVVVAVLLLSFRNLRGILLPLLVVVVSTMWTLGLMGFLGIPISMVSSIMPIVLISVGTAYPIHVLAHHWDEDGLAVEKTMNVVGVAILLAGVTTMAGFSANAFSPVTGIREMGLFTAFGIGIAVLSSITFVPAILALGKKPEDRAKPRSEKRRNDLLGMGLRKLAHFTSRRPWAVVLPAVLLLTAALLSVPHLKAEFNTAGFYKPDSLPVRALNLIEEKFGGADVIQVLIKGDIQEPEILKAMERFQKEIGKIPGIIRPYSLVDVIKAVNEALNEGNPAFRVIPSTREEVAQLLLLLSLGGAEDLDRIVSFDYDQALITARVGSMGGNEKREMIRQAEANLARFFNEGTTETILTGMPVLEQAINELVVKGQLKSLAFAVLFVLILMTIVTRAVVYVPTSSTSLTPTSLTVNPRSLAAHS